VSTYENTWRQNPEQHRHLQNDQSLVYSTTFFQYRNHVASNGMYVVNGDWIGYGEVVLVVDFKIVYFRGSLEGLKKTR
jgi:hypothetical protein